MTVSPRERVGSGDETSDMNGRVGSGDETSDMNGRVW